MSADSDKQPRRTSDSESSSDGTSESTPSDFTELSLPLGRASASALPVSTAPVSALPSSPSSTDLSETRHLIWPRPSYTLYLSIELGMSPLDPPFRFMKRNFPSPYESPSSSSSSSSSPAPIHKRRRTTRELPWSTNAFVKVSDESKVYEEYLKRIIAHFCLLSEKTAVSMHMYGWSDLHRSGAGKKFEFIHPWQPEVYNETFSERSVYEVLQAEGVYGPPKPYLSRGKRIRVGVRHSKFVGLNRIQFIARTHVDPMVDRIVKIDRPDPQDRKYGYDCLGEATPTRLYYHHRAVALLTGQANILLDRAQEMAQRSMAEDDIIILNKSSVFRETYCLNIPPWPRDHGPM